MGRFKADEFDNYGGSGGGGFFSLKNDKDTAQVRFLYNGVEDIEGNAVHKVRVGTRKDGKPDERYVDCLRSYKDPIDVCPFCAAGKKQEAKLFVPLYNIDEDKVQIWDRGKKFFQKISSLCARHPNFVSNIFEIERCGERGDTSTTYEVYHVEKDDAQLEDFDMPDMSTIVLEKSADDMEYYLQEGQFPPTDDDEEERPTRRRSSRRDDDEEEEERPRRRERRTPANSRNKEDVY